MDYPIVAEYKYLGTFLDQKLTPNPQINHIQKKTYFLRSKLSPILYNASLDFRKNLWQTFVIPMYEFLLPIYFYEQSMTKREQIERMLRKSFKSYTGLKKTVETMLIRDLMGYNLDERSRFLHYISEKKWLHRERNEMYNLKEDTQISGFMKAGPKNLCKNLPRIMVKYINMQTCLCPECNRNGIIVRCSKDHLETNHEVIIEKSRNLMKRIRTLKEVAKF